MPKHLLARLAKPKGAMMAVTHDSVGMEDIRDQMLNSKFTIVSRGGGHGGGGGGGGGGSGGVVAVVVVVGVLVAGALVGVGVVFGQRPP